MSTLDHPLGESLSSSATEQKPIFAADVFTSAQHCLMAGVVMYV